MQKPEPVGAQDVYVPQEPSCVLRFTGDVGAIERPHGIICTTLRRHSHRIVEGAPLLAAEAVEMRAAVP